MGQETEGCFSKRVQERIYNLEHNQDSLIVCFDKSNRGRSAGVCVIKQRVHIVAHYEFINFKTIGSFWSSATWMDT